MRQSFTYIQTFFLFLFFACSSGLCQTRQYLDAPLVKSEIRIRLSPGTKTVQWAADEDNTFRNLDASSLFLTRSSIYVTYPGLNPLRLQASASVVSADDPAFATITKLIQALTTLATTIAPTPGPGALARAKCSSASLDIEDLRASLYGDNTSPEKLSGEIQTWVSAIDDSFASGANGPASIQAGIKAIKVSGDHFSKITTEASKQWANVIDCAKTATTDQVLYRLAALTAQDRTRLEQLVALQKASGELSNTLTKDYADSSKWTGGTSKDYIVSSEIKPTFDKLQNVTVKVTSAGLKVDPVTNVLLIDHQDAGSATLTVRKYSSLVPEIGVGAVLGTLKTPVYGTAKNAASQTVVAQTDTKRLSVNPTILANFVCRCGTGLLAPMIQIGVATSKDLPAILLGGGLRLFGLGKGDVALGGGAMFGWYKDLQKLKVGDVVGGTSDINSDLGYITTPKVGGFVAIQYKF